MELPAGGWRAWALALGVLVGGVAGGVGMAFDDGLAGWERLLGVVIAIGAAVLGARLVLMIATSPYFLRLTPAGIDPMGAGEVPWRDVAAIEIGAFAGLEVLLIALVPAEPASRPCFTRRHGRMARRLGGRVLSSALLFSSAPAEHVIAAIGASTDLPVIVELD